jgi:hypothetical protein
MASFYEYGNEPSGSIKGLCSMESVGVVGKIGVMADRYETKLNSSDNFFPKISNIATRRYPFQVSEVKHEEALTNCRYIPIMRSFIERLTENI